MKTPFLILVLILLAGSCAYSQVGINTDNSSPDPSAMLEVKSTSKGMLVPRITQAARAGISSPATGLLLYQTDGTAGFYYYNGTAWQRIGDSGSTGSAHYVGESYGGDMVFWVDNSGQHGYIVSMTDLSTAAVYCATLSAIGAVSTWNGNGNSTMLAGISPAAQLCIDYVNSGSYGTGVYSDWYLPAIDQLSMIYHNRLILNKNLETTSGATIFGFYTVYWSSTEASVNYAFNFNFGPGTAYGYTYKNSSNWVRAVRDF